MKRQEKNVDHSVLRHLGLFKAPPEGEMDLVEARIQQRLRSAPAGTAEELVGFSSAGSGWKLKQLALTFGAVASAVVFVVFIQMPRGIDAHAVVLDGSLSRVSGKKVQSVHIGERIEAGEVLRTNDANGSITLTDGSRVEIRSHSEFSVERAEDGVRIRLVKGGLIINAAKQVAGHLYVLTKDVAVSVVGTVFLVNAEEEGSRVAVIEGEVRVQQGTMTERLLPGEQVATNPVMTSRAVSEEISWSRHAEEHLVLLQQSPVPPSQKGGTPQETFEVVSVKRRVPRPGAGPRGGGGADAPSSANTPCPGPNWFQINPGRFVANNMNLYFLIALAYGNRCPAEGTISGGPDWIRSDNFVVEAKIPEGTPSYTKEQILGGNALQLQRMLQSMLADRFKLVLRRETKEMAAYNLVVVKDGKLKFSATQTPDAVPEAGALPETPTINYYMIANVFSASTARFSRNLQWDVGRPVFDKTGLKGLYDFLIEFPDLTIETPSLVSRMRKDLPARLEEQLGLKLEPTKAPVEVLVLEHAEKPTEN